MKIYHIVIAIAVIGVGSYYAGGRFGSSIEYNKDNICSKGQVNSNMTFDEYTVYCSSKVQATKSEIEKIMEEENFKKITVLRARKVSNDNKKQIEVERNKQAISAIESEYEAIRAEEITLVSKDSVSLK